MSARTCITGATGYLGRARFRKLDRSRVFALVRVGDDPPPAGTRRVLDVTGIRAA